MSKIAVCIMVKDESSIIERCLKSVVEFADLVIITDTGSSDNTIIKAALFLQSNKISYKIYSEPFVDFSVNRNRLLELAAHEKNIDYVLMLDADEVLKIDRNNLNNNLGHDFYNVKLKVGDLIYTLPRLTKNGKGLKYEGVTHEYLNTDNFIGAPIEGIYIEQINDSKRRITNRKFKEDAELLEKAIKEEKNSVLSARYLFYLAQTYQNLREFEKAKEFYLIRAALGGWKEEVFYCYYQVGRILESEDNPLCAHYYIEAFDICPDRIESLVALRNYKIKNGHKSFFSMILGSLISNKPMPANGLFIEEDKYGKQY